jgi:hypothetical protein
MAKWRRIKGKRKFLAWLPAFCLALQCSVAAAESGYIHITGKINPCYHFVHGAVYLAQVTPGPDYWESLMIPSQEDGTFSLVISADGFQFGNYYLMFGNTYTELAFEAERVRIDSPIVDLGTIGKCY